MVSNRQDNSANPVLLSYKKYKDVWITSERVMPPNLGHYKLLKFFLLKYNGNLQLRIKYMKQSRQNMWNKVKISNKIRQGQKTLISIFVSLLNTTTKALFLEQRLSIRSTLHPSFESFGDSIGNSCNNVFCIIIPCKIIWNFTKFWCTFHSPQVKQNLTSSIRNLV